MTEPTHDIIFYIVYPLKLFLGFSVFITNFFVLVIFASKKKKFSSDYLIMPNLLAESVQGIEMCIPFYLLGYKRMFRGAFVFQISIFFSLIMLIIMTLNRYFAVRRPFQYKKMFDKQRTLMIFIAISLLTVLVFATFTYVLFVGHNIVEYRKTVCHPLNEPFSYPGQNAIWVCDREEIDQKDQHIMSVKVFVFYIWPQCQLTLVIFNAFLMCFVYKKISHRYKHKVKIGVFHRFLKLIGEMFDHDTEGHGKISIQETDFSLEERRKTLEQLGQAIFFLVI